MLKNGVDRYNIFLNFYTKLNPPFKLFPFPTERKNSKGRQEWIDLINRSDLNTGESWAPKSHSRVCNSLLGLGVLL
jgi:hypothetical protein